jgi:hypothetical protein
MTETKTIEIPVYRDKEGKPVCHNTWQGIRCGFIEIVKYGINHCRATDTGIDDVRCGKKNAIDWNGHQPHKNCPLWAEELANT